MKSVEIPEKIVNSINHIDKQISTQDSSMSENPSQTKSNKLNNEHHVTIKVDEPLNHKDESEKQIRSLQRTVSIRKSSKSKQTNLDYILSLIGSFGLYQKLQFILVGFLAVVPGMVAYCYVFIAATPKFTCVNIQTDNLKGINVSQFALADTLKLLRMKQEQDKNGSQLVFDNKCQVPIQHLRNNITRIVRCSEWIYDKSLYGPTIATDWNLICSKSHLKAVTQNAYIMGTACAILSGILSDKFGRKTVMMLMITLMTISLNITQFLMHQSILTNAQKFIIFTISRFFQGFGQTMYSVSFVLLLEITGPKHRVLAGNILAYSFAIGELVLCGLAYYLKDWRKIMWFLAVYVLPFFTYYWLVPESPRWLLSKDKVRDAKNVLKRISIMNNTYNLYMASIIRRVSKRKPKEKQTYMENYLKNKESSVYIHSLLQEEANKLVKTKPINNYSQTLIDITKSKMLLKRCFILFYIWMVTLMVYLGMGMGMSNVMDKIIDPYLMFAIQAASEFIGIVTCHLVLNRFGRKIPLIIFMFLTSIVIFLIPVFYDSYPWASCVFYLIAKYGISAAQLTCMIFTSELYPTPMRGTGVGLSACISRLGGVWAPQINVLSSTLGFFVPYALFSSFSLIAGFLTFFLPETLNKSLPENIIEAEKLDKK